MDTPVVTEFDDNINEIPSLLVPMSNCKLILPTVSVAEMIPYQPPQERQNVVTDEIPKWYLGNLTWRGVSVPMVSYEQLNGELETPIRPESQLLILNNTGVSQKMPFICVPTQGIPRLSRVAANEISENKDVQLKDFEEMRVSVAGEAAVIPDITRLEQIMAVTLGYVSHQ